MWDSESESVARDYENGVLSSTKHGVQTDRFEQRGKSWFVATDVPSDFLIQIGDVSFHLHKVYNSHKTSYNLIIHIVCK